MLALEQDSKIQRADTKPENKPLVLAKKNRKNTRTLRAKKNRLERAETPTYMLLRLPRFDQKRRVQMQGTEGRADHDDCI